MFKPKSKNKELNRRIQPISATLERLMKLIVVVDHMLSHDFIPPTKKELTKHGHDLNDLYQLSVEIANRADITMPPQDSLFYFC
jgi:hypothetical protein